MEERYRAITACLSLLILALVLAAVSDEELGRVCIPPAFFAGTLLFGTGAAYDQKNGKKTGSRFQGICALLFLAAGIFSALQTGGIL